MKTLLWAFLTFSMPIDQSSDGLDGLSKGGQCVTIWAVDAGLTLNVRKTQAIFFGSSRYAQRLKTTAVPFVE